MWDPPVTVPCKIPEENKGADDRAPADVDIITRAGENGKMFQKATIKRRNIEFWKKTIN